MPKVKVLHRYLDPPKEVEVEVNEGGNIAQVLRRLGIRYDSAIIAFRGEMVIDPSTLRVSDGDLIEILELADGG